MRNLRPSRLAALASPTRPVAISTAKCPVYLQRNRRSTFCSTTCMRPSAVKRTCASHPQYISQHNQHIVLCGETNGFTALGRHVTKVSSVRSFGQSAFQCSRSNKRSDGPTTRPSPHESLAEQARSVMRAITHPVVVCTAMHNGEPRAMTMSSFTSLTLMPTPLITFNVLTPSRTLDAISSSGQFNVHVLFGDERGRQIADHFTKGNVDGQGLDGRGYEFDGKEKSPLLDDEGVMYVLRCRLSEEAATNGLVRVRDHVIVVGEVVEIILGKDTESTEFGLAYADRAYRRVGALITDEQEA